MPPAAQALYRQDGDTRAAARTQAIAGETLRRGRHAQAREQLTTGVAVLRDDPDADTVQALGAGSARWTVAAFQTVMRADGPLLRS